MSSDNTVFAQLTLDVTPERVGRTAKRLGVQTELRVDGAYVPSMGLGSIAVSPLDMASAYATLAAGGVACEPMAIRKVVLPDGTTDREVSWGKKRCKRVLTEGEAHTVTEILEEASSSAPVPAPRMVIRRPAKTGTTDDHADAWFCGYTPRLQTTVWVGYPKGEIPMENVHGISVTGGSFPAEIWRRFMGAAIGHLEPIDFETPDELPVWTTLEQGQLRGRSATPTTMTTTTTRRPRRPRRRRPSPRRARRSSPRRRNLPRLRRSRSRSRFHHRRHHLRRRLRSSRRRPSRLPPRSR